MNDANAGSVSAPNESSASAARFPACVQPSNPGALGAGEIAPGCYTVCDIGKGGPIEHPTEGGTQVGEHLQLGDGVEVGKVKDITVVNIRPNNRGARTNRPDEQWPMLGSADKKKIEGARTFLHTVNGGQAMAPHKIQIIKVVDRTTLPRDCKKPNVIAIAFCTDMLVEENGAKVSKFACLVPPSGDVGDQGHVHAEN